MKVSRAWLQKYIEETLPSAEIIADSLTMHAFEIEGIEKINDDEVIDVKVLPDRAHYALSHYGIASEIAVILGFQLKLRPEIKLPEISKVLEVEIEDAKLCRRYTGAIIKGIKVEPSPEWLKMSLEAVGQRSINNVVDATNFVLLSLGQPTHVFDLNKLSSKENKYKIAVKRLALGEKIIALDAKEYELKEGALVIVDGNAEKTLAIAGVKGGMEALVDEMTTDILLESANFDPVTVRKTGRGLSLVTDAQKRFENELTPELAVPGLSELIRLITEVAGGTVEGYVDVYPKPVKPYKIGVSLREINQTLGTDLKAQEVENIIQKFGWEHGCVTPHEHVVVEAQKLLGKPYKWGASVLYDAPDSFDCSSITSYLYKEAGVQIPRVVVDQFVYGQEIKEDELVPGDVVFSKTNRQTRCPDTASIEFLKGTSTQAVSHEGVYVGDGNIIHAADPEGVIVEKLKESSRFKEIVGYRRMAKVGEKRWWVIAPAERLDMRIKEDLIEEIGRIYGYEHIQARVPQKSVAPEINQHYGAIETLRSQFVESGYSEVYTYALRDKGEVELENPLASDKAFLRSNLKDGVKESLELNKKNKDLLGLSEIKIFEIGNVFTADSEETHVCYANEKEIIEMTLEEAAEHMKIGEVKTLPEYRISDSTYQPISAYPFIVRDIAVWVPEAVNPEDIVSIIRKESGELLVQGPRQFDTFSKDGKTSFAYRMVYQSMDRTLTIEEVNTIIQKITEIMNGKDGWKVR